MKTYTPKASDLRPQWYVLDASGETLGRLAVRVAHLLKGKHKPTYAPHMLTGDFVIVVNSGKIKVTGNKREQKIYYSHSQYPGGLKEVPLVEMLAKHPNRVIEHAVKGMLPHNRLGRKMFRRLKVYPDAQHPHEAQVTASAKAFEKMESEGPVWVGLPTLTIHKRRKKKKVVEAVAASIAEAAPEAPESETDQPVDTPVAAAETAEATAAPEGPAAPAGPESTQEDAAPVQAASEAAPGPVAGEDEEIVANEADAAKAVETSVKDKATVPKEQVVAAESQTEDAPEDAEAADEPAGQAPQEKKE